MSFREAIVESTHEALASVVHPRFFHTERGYQGGFYCCLMRQFEEKGLLDDERRVVEMEYQKTASHYMSQRPDAIYHIPVEVSGASVEENNYAVWAFKRKASASDAREDFEKLDEMMERLKYGLAFFIDINSDRHYLDAYNGPHRDRLWGGTVQLVHGVPKVLLVPCG
jgi:hypothetical protein